jgi:6-phosphogluconolactonase
MMGRLIVGTYAGNGGQGLAPLLHDQAQDAWSLGQPIRHVTGASFGVLAGTQVVFVDEERNSVGQYDPAAGWQPRGVCDSGGEAPCHVAVDPRGEYLAVANYASGTIALFRAGDRLSGPVARYQNRGGGPDPERQHGPHAHWVGFTPDGSSLLCVDLGRDIVSALQVDRERGALHAPTDLYHAPAGSGPRHLAFHPALPVAYLVSEMAATLTVLHLEPGGWRSGAELSLAPDADTLGGAIAINPAGTRLYVTSRGADCIATYVLDQAGEPALLTTVASGGASPRHLCLTPQHLLCANEQGGSVTIFRLDEGGLPAAPQFLDVPGAAFIVQLPA